MKGLASLLALGVCLSSGLLPIPEFVKDWYGDDSLWTVVTEDIPKDTKGLVERCYQILGNPKENFHNGISGIVNTSRSMGKMGNTSVNTNKIDKMMNVDGLVEHIRGLSYSSYKEDGDSIY